MLTFVGIGPGDPELITLKAVRVLREADAVALPDTGMGSSAVDKIAGELLTGKPLCRLYMPMKGGRDDWRKAHRQAAQTLREWLERYPNIAYPVLGDPGVYATSSYLMSLIAPSHPCCVVPGVPAMCAAAAELGIPLCEQHESLTVTDVLDESGELPAGNVVIMKSGRKLPELKAAAAGRDAYAVRNLGMDGAWMGKLSDVPEDGYSYFTTVIVKH